MLGTIAATEPARLGASDFMIKPFDSQPTIALDYPFTAAKATSRPRQFAATIAVRRLTDRLLKNQNPLENRNNLRSSSPHPGPRQTSGKARRNFAVRNSSTREPWLFRSPVFGSARRSPAATSRGPRLDASRAGCRLRQSHHRLQHSLQPGMNSRPPSRYFRLQIAARLFRRCPQRGKLRIVPDSLCSSMGSAFTETA